MTNYNTSTNINNASIHHKHKKSDFCWTQNEQLLFIYIMMWTSYIQMRWWWCPL